MNKIKLALIGANGKMGKIVLDYFSNHENYVISTLVDVNGVGEKIQNSGYELIVTDNLEKTYEDDVAIAVVFAKKDNEGKILQTIKTCLANGITVINGTTGFNQGEIEELKNLCNIASCYMISNFSIKSVRTTEAVAKIAKFSKLSEIVITERHHAAKVDAPSGTAKSTAQAIFAKKGIDFSGFDMEMVSKKMNIDDPDYPGSFKTETEFNYGGIKIIAIRGENYVADQIVEIGGIDNIKFLHSAPDRKAYMPGLEATINHAMNNPEDYKFYEGLLSVIG